MKLLRDVFPSSLSRVAVVVAYEYFHDYRNDEDEESTHNCAMKHEDERNVLRSLCRLEKPRLPPSHSFSVCFLL